MDLPNIDVASQLLGSQEGHAINTAAVAPAKAVETAVEQLVEDIAKSDAAAFLKNAGYPATLVGAAQFVLAKIEGAIPAANATVAADIKAVLSTAFSVIEGDLPAINL